MISFSLSGNKSKETSYRIKEDTTRQKYEHSWSASTINRPCETCYVLTEIINTSGKIACDGCSWATVMGETHTFPTSTTGKYKLRLSRQDPTIWNTDHVGTWHIDY